MLGTLALALSIVFLPRFWSEQAQSEPKVFATLAAVNERSADSTISFRISIRITPGWHVGSQSPGPIGVPTRLSWRLPSGWRVVREVWPTPEKLIIGKDTTFTYARSFDVLTSVAKGRGSRSGQVEVDVSYGVCKDVCLPGQVALRYVVGTR